MITIGIHGSVMIPKTIDRMKSGRSSIRNKGIAAVFRYLGLIEGWGSGIPRILREAADYGLREPELIDMDSAFRINLYRKGFEFDRFGVAVPGNNSINEGSANYDPMSADLKERTKEEKLLALIRKDPGITQNELSRALNVSIRTVKRLMRMLQDQDLLERSGSPRKGLWKLKDE